MSGDVYVLSDRAGYGRNRSGRWLSRKPPQMLGDYICRGWGLEGAEYEVCGI